MPKFIVQFEARNVAVRFEGSDPTRTNFLTYFHVEAENSESALVAAERLIQDDQKITGIQENSPDFDPPSCDLQVTGELDFFEGRSMPRTGLIFFDDEEH